MKITLKGEEDEELILDNEMLDTDAFVNVTVHLKGTVTTTTVALSELMSACGAFESLRYKRIETEKEIRNDENSF